MKKLQNIEEITEEQLIEFENITRELREMFSVIKREQTREKVRRPLVEMPFDMRFNSELCHATGYEAYVYDQWYNEYIDSEGYYHYGR